MKRIISFLVCALLILSSSVTFAYDIADLQRRANTGDVEALTDLGYAYGFGDGISQDNHKANVYWLKAVSHPEWYTVSAGIRGKVYSNLGCSYHEGRGVRQDYHKAVEYFRKAVDLGNAPAMVHLGVMYGLGQGVRQDYRKAKEYFGMACDHGEQEGCDLYRKYNEAGF
ncbi:MAG: sel1 repeat family protein [Desulfovibrionaceae bacterium]|nr:sel1 repeat family protein [Desulfovibrionaceae bacterium]MBO4793537.1 sel1 repeat family protein [Deltaproteobacteria bacterium]